MELFKNFQIGGLFQAGKRMAPPWGSFRRFTNTYKDQDGTLKPYGRGLEVSNAPSLPAANGAYSYTHYGPLSSQFYKKGILQFHSMKSGGGTQRGVFSYLGPDNSLVDIMQPFKKDGGINAVDTTNHMTYQPSGNFSTCTVARKAYMNSMVNTSDFVSSKPVNGYTPEESWLMSFDGLRLRGAGLPTPWTHVDPSGVLGAHYVRAVYATIGMDGELIMSPYIQQQLSAAVRDIYIGGYSAYPATPRADIVGGTGVTPTYRRPEDHLFDELKTSAGFGAASSNARYFDKRYAASIGVATITSGELSIVCPGYSTSLQVGDWLMFTTGAPLGTVPSTLYMFQVKTLGATVTFQKNMKYLDQYTVSWVDGNFQEIVAEWDAISATIKAAFITSASACVFSNLFLILAYSTSATSGFTVSGITQMAWDSDAGFVGVNLATPATFKMPFAGVISSLMADWYDTTVVQTTFPPLKGITNYKDLLVGFDSNAIYFPNIGLGGSTEMVSGLSNIVPYGSEYGDIVAVCGSEDFLLISRERKNFILTGDIAGTSFNLDECDQAVPGAHNAKCVSNAWSGQVIFMNKAGIFAVNSSGKITDISEDIKGLFFSSNRDNNLFDKTVFKTLADTRSTGFDGAIFKMILEDFRGFVAILTAKASSLFAITGSNMLVLNTKDGKWYEFEGSGASSVETSYGKLVALGTNRAKEDGVMRGTEKQLLVTQRMTIDAPSLEKQFCQIKLYGDITAKTSDGIRSVTVGQINDWLNFDGSSRTNWNTNTPYLPASHQVYAHKKRLNSSKDQATSIILESAATGSFEVEGMEIEGVVIQTEVKK